MMNLDLTPFFLGDSRFVKLHHFSGVSIDNVKIWVLQIYLYCCQKETPELTEKEIINQSIFEGGSFAELLIKSGFATLSDNQNFVIVDMVEKVKKYQDYLLRQKLAGQARAKQRQEDVQSRLSHGLAAGEPPLSQIQPPIPIPSPKPEIRNNPPIPPAMRGAKPPSRNREKSRKALNEINKIIGGMRRVNAGEITQQDLPKLVAAETREWITIAFGTFETLTNLVVVSWKNHEEDKFKAEFRQGLAAWLIEREENKSPGPNGGSMVVRHPDEENVDLNAN